MSKRIRPIYSLIFFCLFFSCLKEETVITTDFDYVKLTETTKLISPFYCKGVIRGMPFSYSTNDPAYANTHFIKASEGDGNFPSLFFSIGNFGEDMPIWFYIESSKFFLTEFLQNKLKVNAEFQLGVTTPNPYVPGFVDYDFDVWLQVRYANQYIRTARYFNCCTPDNKGVLKIANVEYFDDYIAVTFQFTGKLYSSYSEGDILYFGDAFVEMRIRIDL